MMKSTENASATYTIVSSESGAPNAKSDRFLFLVIFLAVLLNFLPVFGMQIRYIFALIVFLAFIGVLFHNKFQLPKSSTLSVYLGLWLVIQCLMLASFVVSDYSAEAKDYLTQEITYGVLFTCCYFVMGKFVASTDENIYRFATPIVLVAVTVFFILGAYALDLNLLGLVEALFSRGESIQYAFFYKLFSGINDGASSAARHGIFYVLYFCMAAFSIGMRSAPHMKRPLFDLSIIGLYLIFIVIFAASRQVVVCLVLFYGLSLYSIQGAKIFFLSILTGPMIYVILPIMSGNVLVEAYEEKYIDDVMENGRLGHFIESAEDIALSPIFGVGLGRPLSTGDFAHNSIIFGFHQGGILVFFFSATLYLYLCKVAMDGWLLSRNFKSRSCFHFAISFAALLVPIAKMTLGYKGQLDFVAWFFLIFAFVNFDYAKSLVGKMHDRSL
jgi:hypothetical protein